MGLICKESKDGIESKERKAKANAISVGKKIMQIFWQFIENIGGIYLFCTVNLGMWGRL